MIMPSDKPAKPEFYKTLMKKDFFPDANKVVKYQESNNYWIFKTGKKVFKVKKKEPTSSTASLEEVFCLETVRRLRAYSPELQAEIITLKRQETGFCLDWHNTIPAPPLYFVLVMNQLTERYFLDVLNQKQNVREAHLDRIAEFLDRLHRQANVPETREALSYETMVAKLKDLVYQSKKYLGLTITQAMLDMTALPLEKFLADNRKFFQKRLRKGVVREIHGCFIPRKIHVSPQGVTALARTSDPIRNRFDDLAADVADLSMELMQAGAPSLATYFVDAYCRLTTDKDLKSALPVFQALKCLSMGVRYSAEAKRSQGEKAIACQQTAGRFYEQAIDVVHHL
jgi:aminoglycoside phosphotransferase family enzyme